MSESKFTLPDVGEGLTEAEIVSWKVKPGDTVKINEIVVEIETAKSLVELPSPFAGVVAALLVEEGQTVEVGTPIITVSTDGAPAAPKPRHRSPTEVAAAAADAADTISEKGGRGLVGYGTGPRRRPGAAAAHAPSGRGRHESLAPAGVDAAVIRAGGLRLHDHRQAADPQARQGPRRRTSARSTRPASRAKSPVTT